MEFTGRISRVFEMRRGTSQRGEWETLPFVFEYFETDSERYSDKVLLETFDTEVKRKIAWHLAKGEDGKALVQNGEYVIAKEIKARCGFGHKVKSVERRDGSGMATFNEIRPYKIEIEEEEGVVVMPQHTGQTPGAGATTGAMTGAQQSGAERANDGAGAGAQQAANGNEDDLPF